MRVPQLHLILLVAPLSSPRHHALNTCQIAYKTATIILQIEPGVLRRRGRRGGNNLSWHGWEVDISGPRNRRIRADKSISYGWGIATSRLKNTPVKGKTQNHHRRKNNGLFRVKNFTSQGGEKTTSQRATPNTHKHIFFFFLFKETLSGPRTWHIRAKNKKDTSKSIPPPPSHTHI